MASLSSSEEGMDSGGVVTSKKRAASGTDNGDAGDERADKSQSTDQSDFKTVQTRASAKRARKQGKLRRSQSNNNIAQSRDEDVVCVFCDGVCSTTDSIECDQCYMVHHLLCCGVPQQHHAGAALLLKLIGWKCQACRLVNKEQQTNLEQTIKNNKFQLIQ